MPLQIVLVDAFTDRPFAGNPAAVCILSDLDSPPPEWWLQDVAREMNLSETAFLVPHEDGYDLRWFTPEIEVDLCGHATLASAHVLWEDGILPPGSPAKFHTRSGLLTVVQLDDWIELDLPAVPAEPIEPLDGLGRALGATPVWTGRTTMDLIVRVSDEKAVRTLRPDMSLLSKFDARGVIVTSEAASAGFDFVSRFFAPRCGIPEDPVTGSAHCTLAEFWADRLGKTEMTGYQVSPRGGTVRVRLLDGRVALAGQAVTVMRGELTV